MPDIRLKVSEPISCACCGSTEFKVFATSSSQHKGYLTRIVQCKRCQFLYSNPKPSFRELERLYSDYEWPAQWECGSEFFNNKIISLVNSVTSAKGRICEVGCSYGKILNALHKKAFRVQGVEASSRACQYIRKHFDFPIYEGFVENFIDKFIASGQPHYDTIIALNVVEHLRDPYLTLSKLDKILVHGGHVLIVVPDVALALLAGWVRKFFHRPDPYAINSGASGGPIAFNSPSHLSFFSRKTLPLVVTRVGWKIIEHRHAPYVLSGKDAPTRKDLLKSGLYPLLKCFARLGLEPTWLWYSQLLLATKTLRRF